jgi:hypothetical protein
MKRIVLMALLTLALPLAAFANQIDFTNHGGTISGSSAGLTLTGSDLTYIDIYGGTKTSGVDLGTVTFTTGALTGGNITTGATFAAGGTFTITGAGVAFVGTFSGPVTWAELPGSTSSGSIYYTLTGNVSGTYNGVSVTGLTTQVTFLAGKAGFMRRADCPRQRRHRRQLRCSRAGHSRIARNRDGWPGWSYSQ